MLIVKYHKSQLQAQLMSSSVNWGLSSFPSNLHPRESPWKHLIVTPLNMPVGRTMTPHDPLWPFLPVSLSSSPL